MAVEPVSGRIVVPFVQRELSDASFWFEPPAAGDPSAEQRRLAKAGWGGDQGQLAMDARVQSLDQARARHQLWPDRGDMEFGLQEWCGHLFRSWRTASYTAPIISLAGSRNNRNLCRLCSPDAGDDCGPGARPAQLQWVGGVTDSRIPFNGAADKPRFARA